MEAVFHSDGNQIAAGIRHMVQRFSSTTKSAADGSFGGGKQPKIDTRSQKSFFLPALESLSIFQCNHLEAICYGISETPLLVQVHVNGNQYSVTKDINAAVKKLNRCSGAKI